MFTPHQSVHQFSPQRRQILGTAKRTGQKKAFLGDEEANTIGPQKLFSDLKNTSAKKAGTSKVSNKSPSRALGVKNTQSPERSQESPSKSSLGRLQGKSLETKSTLQNESPAKEKGKAKSTSKSPTKAVRQESPTKQLILPLSTTPHPSIDDLDEGTSYHTTSTPFIRLPQTPPANINAQQGLQQQASFVTPASNIGEAGAMRQRKGELFDALNQVQGEGQLREAELLSVSQEALEEDEYPEIEYMPPSVEVPYGFPPQLDGLPRARQLGESMGKMSLTGFYKPSNEEKRQELMAEIFKYRPGKIEIPTLPPLQLKDDEDESWPDVEITVPKKTKPTSSKATVTSQRSAVSNKAITAKGSRTIVQPGKTSTSVNAKTFVKPRALGEKDSNATMKRSVMNPALRDFDNDKMGKIIKAKLQASQANETEGFLL